MAKKKRDYRKLRPTSGNLRVALNELIELVNASVGAAARLPEVKRHADLYLLRERVAMHRNNGGLSKPQTLERTQTEPPQDAATTEYLRDIIDLATNAWRAQRKMVDADTGEPRDEMKRVYRHIEAQFSALDNMGIEIRDMTGRKFDTGMALKVIAFEPQAGIQGEEITETIRPSIAWNNKLIQIGEVIVGMPAEESN